MLLDTSVIFKKCIDLSAATLHYVCIHMLKQFACYEKPPEKCFQRMPSTPQPLISRLFPFPNTQNHTNSRIYGLILMTLWWSDIITKCTDNDEHPVSLSPPHPLESSSMHGCPAALLVHEVLILTAFH